MKVNPAENEEVDPFWSWHANIHRLNNRKHILFVNDLTRLCIMVNGVRSAQLATLKEKFIATLISYLQSEGVNPSLIHAYVTAGTDLMISKTNNRSVLGTMKEIMLFSSDDFDDDTDRLKWLNSIIYKPIDYKEPINVFKEALFKNPQVRTNVKNNS